MWLWAAQLRELGFRRKSERYWQCDNRHGLPTNAHCSIFSWSEQSLPGGRFLVELTEFHVTFEIGFDNVHFYYHETSDYAWAPGGHTSFGEIAGLGVDPAILREEADEIARRCLELVDCLLVGREGLL
jgi:hypothetical protein